MCHSQSLNWQSILISLKELVVKLPEIDKPCRDARSLLIELSNHVHYVLHLIKVYT